MLLMEIGFGTKTVKKTVKVKIKTKDLLMLVFLATSTHTGDCFIHLYA